MALGGGAAIGVAPSYRVNAFGFLALAELAAVDPRGTSGNMGITDQQAALQWVQRNAAAFGGDASRVTLYGQSSGGTSIFSLLSSPLSKGLFQSAISLSGSPLMVADLKQACAQVCVWGAVYGAAPPDSLPILLGPNGHASLAPVYRHRRWSSLSSSPSPRHLIMTWSCGQNKVGWLAATPCANADDVLSCIYDLSPEAVVAAVPALWDPPTYFPNDPAGNNYPALAIIDGHTVTLPLLEALSTGLNDVPLILTTMRDEWDLFQSQNASIVTWNYSQLASYLDDHFTPWSPTLGATLLQLCTWCGCGSIGSWLE